MNPTIHGHARASRRMVSTTQSIPGRFERIDTLVIGGGQAGLATGYELAARDINFAILSNEARIGDNWRRRWDSLRLFTPAARSGLPGTPFPGPPGHLADKDEMADYLERYAERFNLPVRLNTKVESLDSDGGRFRLATGGSVLEADSVVVATGAFQRARVPPLAARLSPDILQLHTSEYRNPSELPDGPVLVVGAGNSGAQIALELARTRTVWLAGRDTGHVPRRLLGRDIFDWAWPVMSRATLDTRIGRRLREKALQGGDALIGIPESSVVKAGIVRLPKVMDVRGGLPVCGETVVHPRVVIWATGFAPDYSWIKLPVCGADGYPRHRRGVAEDAKGLYFMGLRFQYRMNSSLVGGVGADAAFIADQIGMQSGVLEARAG
jgi:putative flavoprotein involved in K+ transport